MTVAVQRLVLIQAADPEAADPIDPEVLVVKAKLDHVKVWWPLMSEMDESSESDHGLLHVDEHDVVLDDQAKHGEPSGLSIAKANSILAHFTHLDVSAIPNVSSDSLSHDVVLNIVNASIDVSGINLNEVVGDVDSGPKQLSSVENANGAVDGIPEDSDLKDHVLSD